MNFGKREASSAWSGLHAVHSGIEAVHLSDRSELEIERYYSTLFGAWGPQHWWPAESRFEVIVGAYLTQNTAWTNVEKAMANLRAAQVLSVKGIREVPLRKLERMVRPSGYFRQKAKRLKLFVGFLDREHRGSLTKMFALSTEELREQLLSLNGIGPETADSILLYAGNHPVFVVDAYTRRILVRHQIMSEDAPYEEVRQMLESALSIVARAVARSPRTEQKLQNAISGAAHPPSAMSMGKRTPLARVYNEMHALIVGVGKNYCRKSQPQCDNCPLRKFLP